VAPTEPEPSALSEQEKALIAERAKFVCATPCLIVTSHSIIKEQQQLMEEINAAETQRKRAEGLNAMSPVPPPSHWLQRT
jgi:hypothetical protein